MTVSTAINLQFSSTHYELTTEAAYNLKATDGFGGSSGAQRAQLQLNFSPNLYSDYFDIDYGSDYYYNNRNGFFFASYFANGAGSDSGNLLQPPIQNGVVTGRLWYKVVRDGGSLVSCTK